MSTEQAAHHIFNAASEVTQDNYEAGSILFTLSYLSLARHMGSEAATEWISERLQNLKEYNESSHQH